MANAIGAIQVGLAVLPSELAFYPMVVVGGDVYVPPPVMVSRVSFDTAQHVIFNTSASTGVFANGTADFVSFDVKTNMWY